jgi:hypothetical protein
MSSSSRNTEIRVFSAVETSNVTYLYIAVFLVIFLIVLYSFILCSIFFLISNSFLPFPLHSSYNFYNYSAFNFSLLCCSFETHCLFRVIKTVFV